MIDPGWKLWAVIVLVGAANYLSRLSFIELLSRRSVPPLVATALRYVAVAMLTALVLPMVLTTPAGLALDGNPRVPAAIVAGAVAFFTRSMPWTLAAGMAVMWGWQAVLG
jgi:branched-subunit amino acid transport protein